MVYRGLTRGGIRWGEKCCVHGWVFKCVMVMGVCLGSVFGVEMLVRYWKCIDRVGIVYDNTVMQWFMVRQCVAESGGVKSDV